MSESSIAVRRIVFTRRYVRPGRVFHRSSASLVEHGRVTGPQQCISGRMPALDEAALRQLFLDARTHSAWQDRPVSDETLRQLYELVRMGPTGNNSTPFRVVFVKSADAKEKLKPALAPGNVDKTMNAPVTAVVAFDLAFH